MSIGEKYFPHFMMIILAITLDACGSKTSETPVVTPPAISVTITAEDCPSVEVQPGMQVAWTNGDEAAHIVQSELLPDGSRKFDSGELQPGDSLIFTFMETGSYAYQCSTDGTIMGTVTVSPR
jgi:plastocyanin